ncbi:Homeobox domain containing protein [Coccidioides posadasii C735 delta SOWgp]|uniref:Homeobox domain-containing protein n=2 Tax=Coccidioides posadasii TaxID=199306 RepID=A0A0J6FE13_COCPO|nr:Homeobox domain containing protein [Coccidioides posadasii C735 delta SOWgp]EER27319.1 Homeobox domain containing protein [Coccidioides posadasii C735 delta SOWgp]KMM67104.1 hypothetical protein CPAG_03440 [Coccidioides posadasii RMSCC 3488]|eukprot:XP_003069464.1 Homeobox domain containing protein [Coccidioides posadasii C735 delta SOWgp]
MSNESQQHIPNRTGLDVLSGAEFTEIQESMGNMNPSDSMSFDLNSIFPRHRQRTVRRRFCYVQPQDPESIGKLSNWSEDAVEVLKKWLKQDCRHPYPTKQEKAELAEQTELTVTQVSTWFANARRRGRHASADRCLTSTSLNCPDKPRKVSDEQWPSFSPLDRWRNSPPEVEAASLEAIRSAVARSGTSYLPTGDLQHQSPPEDNDARSLVSSKASGSAVSTSTLTILMDLSVAFTWRKSLGAVIDGKQNLLLPTPSTKRSVGKRPYQSPNHRKAISSPIGLAYASRNLSRCERFTARTIWSSILRLVHGVNNLIPSMDTWKSQVTNINSRCGFCGETFTLWSERNDHIAWHFRKGALMKDWRGCRGLDPSVALAVGNAMPPYLIGIESTGIEPFSASRLAAKDARGAEPTDQRTSTASKPTPFGYLTARLTGFVNGIQAAGGTVSDELLQKEASCIMYGDDDPWNQTAADNPEWLKLFKEGMGLCAASGPPQSLGSEDYSFCLPWAAGQWEPFNATTNPISQDSSEPMLNEWMSWAWHSPECLVEYRQSNMAAGSSRPTGKKGS